MAKKKKIEEVKKNIETSEIKTEITNKAPKAEETIIEVPAKKSKMYRARIVRKKLVRE